MTLGSLFDGSGTCPLAARMLGITPVWASEIEPYPIAVTKKNFPEMLHLGSITDIDGAAIPKVDIITGGSPCQDLSVAGKQKGLENGERSHLFYEQIRVIKEMRADDKRNGRTGVDVRPRFGLWENVPGALSSNCGEDFRSVLQQFCQVAEEEGNIDIPRPKKWDGAGCIVGRDNHWSVAWRILDAQYWGVPQRRRRIFLVADFAGGSAGKILFEREGLPRDFEPCGATWETLARDAEGSPA